MGGDHGILLVKLPADLQDSRKYTCSDLKNYRSDPFESTRATKDCSRRRRRDRIYAGALVGDMPIVEVEDSRLRRRLNRGNRR